MNKCDYSPQVLPSSPLSPTKPTLVQVNFVRFTYPYVSPTITINLKTPELNNSQTMKVNSIMRETRGKTFKHFRYSMWPKYEKLVFTFMGISQTTADSILNFLNTSCGKEIGYLDYESRQWKGLILNPDSAISQEAPGCSFSFQVEFEGSVQ